MKIWSALPLRMSEQISLGYNYQPCFFPSWKWVDYTIELTALTAQKRLGPSCWGSFLGEEPVRIIYGGVCAPTALQRGAETTFCLSYGLFRHTHEYGRIIPHGIVGASQGGEWWTFLVHPGGCIFCYYVKVINKQSSHQQLLHTSKNREKYIY